MLNMTLLLKVSRLLEDIIETLNISGNEDAMKSIKEAEEDVKAGRVRSYSEFLKEMKESGRYSVKVTRSFERNFRKFNTAMNKLVAYLSQF